MLSWWEASSLWLYAYVCVNWVCECGDIYVATYEGVSELNGELLHTHCKFSSIPLFSLLYTSMLHWVLSLLQSTYRLLTHLSISLTISPNTWLNLTISLSTTTTSHLDHSKYLLASYLFWFPLPTIHFPHQARVSF